MLVKDVMTSEVLTVEEGVAVAEAVQLLRRHKVKGVPVVDAIGRVCGMFTVKHLFQVVADGGKLARPVRELMQREVTVIRDDTSLEETCGFPQKRLPVVDAGGNLVGMLTKSDIIRGFKTTFVHARQELKAVLEATPHGIVAVNPQGYITFVNPAAEKILRLKAERVIGGDVSDFIPNCAVIGVLATGRAIRNFKNTINGTTYLGHAAPVMDGSDIIGAVASFQPFSEIESLADELGVVKQLYKELDAVISCSYDGILVTEADGAIRKVNAATVKLLGLAPSQSAGAGEEGRAHQLGERVAAKVCQDRKPCSISCRINGRQVALTGTPVFDENGAVVRIVTNVRDLSELSALRQELEEVNRLKEMYFSELARLKAEVATTSGTYRSAEMQRVYDLALRVAVVDTPVLIHGESGVGKEVLANYIHDGSARRDGAFIKINCAAIPETLLESELFGYAEGAFSGARRGGKPGVFEIAHGGTLFMDEIGELPGSIQAKLLRVLQDQEFFKVGGSRPVKFDARLLFATNRDLEAEVKAGRFREDLFYRINVVPLFVPPLRERPEDIVALTAEFLAKMNCKYKTDKKLSAEIIEAFTNYPWPGNVRELINVLERVVITSRQEFITLEDLPGNFRQQAHPSAVARGPVLPLKNVLDMVERDVIEQSLRTAKSLRQAAKALGIDPSTLLRKAEKHKIRTGVELPQQPPYIFNGKN
ncbi:sigma 54-interacting transcriptional regulator [Anaeroselena agilis]|uniref:HTH-type transcriptional regulatory protein TyrR n=1 Tax=Anaeroselena agilis TaxID=3063788 RepID=A0ABU3NZ04_9FIRM|nr:sigma 54-interacting transcriptional regulator [Selenomonadales bacterium 4137-cl]